MRRFLPFIGLLLLPIGASAEGLYDYFRSQVETELAAPAADETVISFIRGVYKDRWPMSNEEVEAAIRGESWDACKSEDSLQENRDECLSALENIQMLAREEQSLRSFGRSFLRIATAQEMAVTEIPGRPFHLVMDLSGILNIWRAGTGSITETVSGAILLRTRPLTEDEVDNVRDAFTDLAEALEVMQKEEQTAVVWRYQYGVRLVRGERNPRYPPPVEDSQSGPGTERQYVFKSWPEVEDALKSIWDRLPKERSQFDPPLGDNEVAYILFPDEFKEMLPAGMLPWARIDRAPESAGDPLPHFVLGDVGIVWEIPLEPLLPSLLSIEEDKEDEPILGGRYPPDPTTARTNDQTGQFDEHTPVDGAGLCSMALAQRGHLCRSLVMPEGLCPDEQIDPDVITLVSCSSDERPMVTVAGSDVCQDIEWRNDQDNEVKHCAVDPNEDSEYELVKIQQRCIMKKDDPYEGLNEEEQNQLCCRLEGEAHLVECKAKSEDGFLRDGDRNPLVIDGLEVTPQICMEILRLESCSRALGRDVRCPVTSLALTADDAGAVRDVREPDDPNKEARIAARIRTIERHQPVCEPGTVSEYKNTIGNNVCFIGQCAEESLELHRLTGGRSPATTLDSAFPWDNPDTGEALATMLRSVPVTTPPLPSYRPQLVLKSLEDALCELQGLPASTPPHLCAFAPSRRLALPLGDAASTALALTFNVEEQRDATILTESLAAGLGSRIGTDMHGQYLRIGTRTLSEVIALANTLLKETLTITFPTNMCPLSLAQ